jgi:exonuclease VII large subunit
MRTTNHKYSLRPNAKGRKGHQSADDPDGQVESTSTSTSACSEGHDITDELCDADPGHAALYTPKAAHNTPVPEQDSAQERTKGDQRRFHGLTAPTTRHVIETWEEIEAWRKREEARRCAEAVRIRREQIVRGFEAEIRGLRARIVALRHECEERVARVQRKWERARAIKRDEVAMVEDDGEVMGESDSEDVDYEMDI